MPHDWHDLEEDISLQARTVPVSLGPKIASVIIVTTLCISLVLSGVLFRITPLQFSPPFYLAAMFIGIYLLIFPAFRLFQTRARDEVAALFNRASYYPLGAVDPYPDIHGLGTCMTGPDRSHPGKICN